MALSPYTRTCPYCGASPTPFQKIGEVLALDDADGRPLRWLTAFCPACARVALFELDPNTGIPMEMIPSPSGEWDVAHLPAGVEAIWREAVKVFNVGANASAVVQCGRALEQAATERNIQKGSLAQRINAMREQGLVTAEFGDAMDYARLIRNVGAHAGKEVSRESAEGAMRFTQQTLRLLFEVPGEL